MQGAFTLGTSSSLNTASCTSISRHTDGIPPTRSSACLSSKAELPFSPLKTVYRRRCLGRAVFGRNQKFQRAVIARADARSDGSTIPIAPLLPESPTGQFLVQLLQSHPHLVSAAAEQQLEKLVEDRDAASTQEQPSTTGYLVLYRRIAELKAQERRTALEEIMYALIVQRFVETGVSMVPQVASLSENEQAGSFSAQDKTLELVHSPEALEMIQEHLALVLGGRGTSDYLDHKTVAQISKLRVGQVYAASVMYGYFLRRVDRRFQLEKSMKVLPPGLDEAIEAEQEGAHQDNDDSNSQQESLAAEVAAAVAAIAAAGGMKQNFNSAGFTQVGLKSSKLRSYVMSFDTDTLQRCATIRSKESISVIEKHTEALFGKPEIQITPDGSMAIAKDEIIRLSFSGLRRLVLEAVAFGSFLWDVETYVDNRYDFVAH